MPDDDRGASFRTAWDSGPPDLLGIRTSMTGDAPPEAQGAPDPSREQAAGPPPEALPLSFQGPNEPSRGATRVAEAAPDRKPTGDGVVATGLALPVIPSPSAPLPLAPAPSTVSVGKPPAIDRGKSLVLEYAEAPRGANRPAPARIAPIPRDGFGRTARWFPGLTDAKLVRAGGPLVPTSHVVATTTAPAPPRIPIVSRFVDRIRGATRGFLDPGSVRREPRDVAERGQVIQRVSADRVDEPSKR